MGLYTIAIIFS